MQDITLLVSIPWFVVRDFNAMFGAHEKIDPPSSRISYEDFRFDSANLLMIDTKGSFFTWAQCGLKAMWKVNWIGLSVIKLALIFGILLLVLLYQGRN